MKRVFLSVQPPREIQEELFQLTRSWGDLPCRWLPVEDLHVTLAFLGNTGEQELEDVFSIMEEIGSIHGPTEVYLHKIGYGPHKKTPPSLVWVEGESEGLTPLVKDLERGLEERTSYKSSQREFFTHITLGRVNKMAWRRLEERPSIEKRVDLSFVADTIYVMESKLNPIGAEYTVLKRVRL